MFLLTLGFIFYDRMSMYKFVDNKFSYIIYNAKGIGEAPSNFSLKNFVKFSLQHRDWIIV